MISIISLVISIVAVIAAIGSMIVQINANRAQIDRNEKDTNAIFANLWFELDQMFIEHPSMHKYFYNHCTDLDCPSADRHPVQHPEDEQELELAICIAERIVDVFQYAELFKDSLNEEDRKSYEQYKESIFSSSFMQQVVKPIWINNGSQWIIPDRSVSEKTDQKRRKKRFKPI